MEDGPWFQPWAEGPRWPEKPLRQRDPECGSWLWSGVHRRAGVGTAGLSLAGIRRATEATVDPPQLRDIQHPAWLPAEAYT